MDHLLNKDIQVRLAESTDPSHILSEYFKSQKEPEKCHAVIDVGALFNDYTNEKVVEAIEKQVKQIKDSTIKYI